MDPVRIDEAGWWPQAQRYESPNCDARPPGMAVELLVIHNISLPAGQFGGPHIADLFTNRVDFHADPSFADLRGLNVSSHFLIRRDGRALQFVSCEASAWHAGRSCFKGRDKCNDFSIGIELEGTDFVAFSPAQYATLAVLTIALTRRYRLAHIAGHSHIAPGRKTDPGPCFDWAHYRQSLRHGGLILPSNGAALVDAPGAIALLGAVSNVKPAGPKK